MKAESCTINLNYFIQHILNLIGKILWMCKEEAFPIQCYPFESSYLEVQCDYHFETLEIDYILLTYFLYLNVFVTCATIISNSTYHGNSTFYT